MLSFQTPRSRSAFELASQGVRSGAGHPGAYTVDEDVTPWSSSSPPPPAALPLSQRTPSSRWRNPALCADDGYFGPVSTCRAFDLTLRFESSILSLLPNAIFELIALGLIAFTVISRRRYIQLSIDRAACGHQRDDGANLLALLHLALMVALLVLAPRICLASRLPRIGTLVVPALVLETSSA